MLLSYPDSAPLSISESVSEHEAVALFSLPPALRSCAWLRWCRKTLAEVQVAAPRPPVPSESASLAGVRRALLWDGGRFHFFPCPDGETGEPSGRL